MKHKIDTLAQQLVHLLATRAYYKLDPEYAELAEDIDVVVDVIRAELLQELKLDEQDREFQGFAHKFGPTE